MILLVVEKDRLVMSFHLVDNIFYKRVYDKLLGAEVEVYKRKVMKVLPRFKEV